MVGVIVRDNLRTCAEVINSLIIRGTNENVMEFIEALLNLGVIITLSLLQIGDRKIFYAH